MTLLVEATINSTLHRISNEWVTLTNRWKPLVASVASLKIETPKKYGGYAKPSFSDISFSPELFDNDWPPPASFPIKVMDTQTTEAASVVIFEGTAHIDDVDTWPISAELFQPGIDVVIPSGTVFNGTLESIITWFCDATRLNLSMDYTYGRGTSPAVKYTTTSDQSALSLLSGISEFFSHAFKIFDDTLYLFDMKDASSPTTLNVYTSHVMPSYYSGGKAVNSVECEGHIVESSNSYADDVESLSTAYHDTEANIITALTDILSIIEKPTCNIDMEMHGETPVILNPISYAFARLHDSATFTGRICEVIYDYDQDKMNVVGPGAIS